MRILHRKQLPRAIDRGGPGWIASADAIEHLRRAIEAWPDFRSLAAKDSDFDSIRNEPGFQELVSESA